MIASLFFLFADLPPMEKNFEEWKEFLVLEEKYEDFVGESLIGSEKWSRFLQQDDPRIPPESIDTTLRTLFERYAKVGSTVIDYGARCGGRTLLFQTLVGTEGKVLAFESNLEYFRALFWNLVRAKGKQALIFCPTEEETLDTYPLENVSLIIVDADGRESCTLAGAEKTIRRFRPTMILNMLGGIPIEQGDRFFKQEFERRMKKVHQLNYTTQRIKDSWYLALPKSH